MQQVQAIGALYLLFIAANHLWRKKVTASTVQETKKPAKTGGFRSTVIKVELADIAFAVDSILAAVALAVALPASPLPAIGGMDGGHFLVILAGGLIGLVLMRFAANNCVRLLEQRPGLEKAAFLIVGWVGVELAVYAASHPGLALLPETFAKSGVWKGIFWAVLLAIFAWGWFGGKGAEEKAVAEQGEPPLTAACPGRATRRPHPPNAPAK